MMPIPQTVEAIRDLKPEDRPAISALARRAFPVHQSGFVVPGNMGGKVMTLNNNVVAASLLRVVVLPSGRKIGFVAWLMTHPECRGRGFARQLVEASTARLQAAPCDDIVTDVEGYNTDSATVFYKAGYRRMSFWQLRCRWNPVDLMWLSIQTGHAFDPGHFFWVAHAPTPRHTQWKGRLFAVLFNTLIAVFAFALGGGLLRSGNRVLPSVQTIFAFLIGICSLLAARELGSRVVAWRHQTPLEFRAWSGGWGIALLIAIGFGNTFPLPGNVYLRGDGWNVRQHQALLGQGAIVSSLLVACLLLLGFLLSDATCNPFLCHVAQALRFVGKPLLVFDTLVTVAPFEGFNGRHLYAYHRLVWLVLSGIAVIIFFMV